MVYLRWLISCDTLNIGRNGANFTGRCIPAWIFKLLFLLINKRFWCFHAGFIGTFCEDAVSGGVTTREAQYAVDQENAQVRQGAGSAGQYIGA
jgi:hypothetical protein